jgi:hypothetical protein
VVACSSPQVGPPGPGRFSLRLRVAQQALRFASGHWLAPMFVLAFAVLRFAPAGRTDPRQPLMRLLALRPSLLVAGAARARGHWPPSASNVGNRLAFCDSFTGSGGWVARSWSSVSYDLARVRRGWRCFSPRGPGAGRPVPWVVAVSRVHGGLLVTGWPGSVVGRVLQMLCPLPVVSLAVGGPS